MKYIRYIVFFVIAGMVSCGRSDAPYSPIESDSEYISFSGTSGKKFQLKSDDGTTPNLVTTDALLQSASFGLFGYKSTNDQNGFVSVFPTTGALEVKYESGNWTYSPKQKWERSMHYRFRAVWPYKPDRIIANSSANLLSVEYSSFVEDHDMMVAYATRYPLSEGVDRVRLEFKHVLAGLRFKIKFSDTTIGNTDDAVTGFYITGIYPHGQLLYGTSGTVTDVNAIRWFLSDNVFNSTDKQFPWTGNIPFGGSDKKTANIYFTETPVGTTGAVSTDGAALLIPQTLSSEVGTTYVNFYTSLGGTALHRVALPRQTLEAGKIYTYTLTIHGTQIKIKVDIQKWDEIQSNIDIKL